MKFPLVGNERTKSAVENMISAMRIPHAILIEGAKGSGKTTLADFICAAAICKGENKPCGECRCCRLLSSNSHPDVTVISPEKDRKTISVNQVREIILSAAVLPQSSDKKVLIIEPADAMTVQAQNALLKILEEPPKSVIFILTAKNRSDLLSTIISRCTLLSLSSPDEKTAVQYISSVLNREASEIIPVYRTAYSIGSTINLLKSKSASKTSDIAELFFCKIQSGSQYELMTLMLPLEKDRAKALDFYNELEAKLISGMKNASSPTIVRRYEKLLSTVTDHKKLIKSNTNLSLLFSHLAVKMTER